MEGSGTLDAVPFTTIPVGPPPFITVAFSTESALKLPDREYTLVKQVALGDPEPHCTAPAKVPLVMVHAIALSLE